MFDTMTLTKIAASLCGALLVFLLTKWVAEGLFHSAAHGPQAYVIDLGAEEVAEPEVEVPFETILASADVGAGERVFRKCSACHKVADGENSTGPHLYGVVGRTIAVVDGFGYSQALVELGGTWTPDALNAFLEKPRTYAAGTTMSFNGLAKIEDRADVIAYLQSLGG